MVDNLQQNHNQSDILDTEMIPIGKRTAKTSFLFDPSLKQYLDETHELEKERLEVESEPGRKLNRTFKNRRKNNNDHKSETLNKIIFPSMANLIHFFEYVNFHSIENKGDLKEKLDDEGNVMLDDKGENRYELRYKNDHYLQGKFDDDVKDLFGIRGQHLKMHYEDDRRYVAFSRLIDGFLNYQNEEVQLQLMSILGDILIKRIRNLGMAKDWDLGLTIINQDLGRMSFWIKYCTSGIKSDLKEPSRKIAFPLLS